MILVEIKKIIFSNCRWCWWWSKWGDYIRLSLHASRHREWWRWTKWWRWRWIASHQSRTGKYRPVVQVYYLCISCILMICICLRCVMTHVTLSTFIKFRHISVTNQNSLALIVISFFSWNLLYMVSQKTFYIHYLKILKEHDQHHLWYVDTLRSSC